MAKIKTVLYIEDEPDIVMMYEVKFTQAGYQFFTAPRAEEGIALAHAKKPDIILLDIKLEGNKDGIFVLKSLKEKDDTKNIPVILFSNAYKKEYKEQGKELGAVDFVVKSQILPEETLKLVKKYLK